MLSILSSPCFANRRAAPGLTGPASWACLFLLTPLAFAQIPPNPVVYMPFDNGPGIVGSVTTNLGTLFGSATLTNDSWIGLNTNLSIQDTNYPMFTTNVPVGQWAPTGARYSLDLGLPLGDATAGNYGRAVDLLTGTGDGTVGSGAGVPYYPGLTVCAWVNNSFQYPTDSWDMQVVYALTAPDANGVQHGFAFAIDRLGDLMLGINQDSESGPWSDPVVPYDSSQPSQNWRFIAATYQPDPDGTNGFTAFYVGSTDELAYDAGIYDQESSPGPALLLGTNTVLDTGPVTIGDYNANNPARDAMGPLDSHQFDGWIRDVRVYTNAFTVDQIQQAQINSAVPTNAVVILQQPSSITIPDWGVPTFQVEANGAGTLTYQWFTSGDSGSTWTWAVGATGAVFSLGEVSVAQSGELVRVGVTNGFGVGLLSSNAQLTVLPAPPPLIQSFSFSEGSVLDPMAGPHTNDDGLIFSMDAGFYLGGALFIQNGAGAAAIGQAMRDAGISNPGLIVITNFSAGAYPCFSTNVPVGPWAPDPRFNKYSLNMGDTLFDSTGNPLPDQGGRYVIPTNNIVAPFVGPGSGGFVFSNTLGAMRAVTVCGWINSGNTPDLIYSGADDFGNPIMWCTYSPTETGGFQLDLKADGTLQFIAINWWNTDTSTRSSPNIIVGNTNHPNDNWVFFAVTYDGTLTNANLNYYWGGPNDAATNDVNNPMDYNQGTWTYTGTLAIGNVNLDNAGGEGFTCSDCLGTNAAFCRGLLDEIRIFNKVLSLDEIRQVQVSPAGPPELVIGPAASGNNLLSWAQSSAGDMPQYQLQSKTNLPAGSWSNVTNPPNASGVERRVTLPAAGKSMFYRLLGN